MATLQEEDLIIELRFEHQCRPKSLEVIQACPVTRHPISNKQICHGRGYPHKGILTAPPIPNFPKAGIEDSSLLCVW